MYKYLLFFCFCFFFHFYLSGCGHRKHSIGTGGDSFLFITYNTLIVVFAHFHLQFDSKY